MPPRMKYKTKAQRRKHFEYNPRRGPEENGPVSAIQRRIKKGEEGMSRSKAGASEYARWCREVGIQVEVLVENTPLGCGVLMHPSL